MPQETPGRRVFPGDDGKMLFSPGDYGLDPRDGEWYARPPGEASHMGSLANHEVEEHEDGTITVSPSILVKGPLGEWHGYLKQGLWREC